MKTRFIQIATLLAVLMGLPAVLHAALSISDADIQDGKYIYDLTFADMTTTSPSTGQFFEDVWSWSNIALSTEDNWKYVRAIDTSANFIYKFDFSDTNFRIEKVDIAGTGRLFGDTTGNIVGTVSIYYSLTGNDDDWTLITSSDNKGFTGSTTNRGYNTAASITLTELAETFWYKVVFDVEKGTASTRYQWNRINSTDNPFTVTFDVAAVPEPATVALLSGLSVLLVALCLGRRLR
ncbi:hypothetical protein OPIT5_12345 [Opitutaceae bacterium TAV5]|nr:hypothetical protein OPIT5_12345 [Opitutaceae bacterium TAV5]